MSIFFDTNILVYAFSDDPRRVRAQAVLAGGGVISVQVLNEFTSTLHRKQKQDWPVIEAALAIVRARFPTVTAITVETHASAVALARDHRLNFYDALIVAAAAAAGCAALMTEDMQDGRKFGRLEVKNPFA